jgi:tetratricopeptide (TPR) repeat protein
MENKTRCSAIIGFAAVLLAGLLSSCNGVLSGLPGKFNLVAGNFFAARGMNIDAISAYLAAKKEPLVAPWADYGLGTCYLAMNQMAAALKRFEAAEKEAACFPAESTRKLRFSLAYNSGVARFRLNDFTGSAEEFKDALEAENDRVDAKRNLELALLSLNRTEKAEKKARTQTSVKQTPDEKEARDILFNFLRTKEVNHWKSRTWDGRNETGPDY